jgi:hypothetical protein
MGDSTSTLPNGGYQQPAQSSGGYQQPPAQQPQQSAASAPFGTTPDFWHALASFGANMAVAANERTNGGFLKYGGGIAGPMGAGVLGMMESQALAQKQQAALGYQGAQTADVLSQLAQRRLQTQQMQQQMRFRQQYAQQLMQGTPGGGGFGGAPFSGGGGGTAPGMAPTPGAASNGGGQGMPLSSAIGTIEDPTGKSINPQGYVGKYQFGTGALQHAGLYAPAPGEDLTRNLWAGQITLPGQQPMNVNDFRNNVPAQDQAFQIHRQTLLNDASQMGLGQYVGQTVGGVPINPDTLVGLMHFGGATGARQFLQTGGQYNPADANGTTLAGYGARVNALMTTSSPATAQAAAGAAQQRQRGPGGVGGGFAGGGTQAPAPSQAPIPGGGGMTPEQAQQMANYYFNRARLAKMSNLDDSADLQQAKAYQDYSLAGPTEYAKSQAGLPAQMTLQNTKPQVLRSGEGAYYPTSGTTVQNPAIVPGQGPQGQPTRQYASPPTIINGVPTGGFTGAPVTSGPSPSTLDLQKTLATQFAEQGQKSYAAAQGTIGWAQDMDHAIDALNSGGGWSSTGPANNARMSIANATNAVAYMFGGTPPFDPNKIATWEQFNKATRTAGMQLVSSQFGASREAATTIMSATQAVPSAENSPIGAKLVLNGIRETAQNEVDRHNFELQWQAQHGGDLTGAREAFDQTATPQMYQRRAISTVQPPVISDPSQLNNYLPGTYFVPADSPATLKQVPMRPGMPAPPDWLNSAAQGNGQQTQQPPQQPAYAPAAPIMGNQ